MSGLHSHIVFKTVAQIKDGFVLLVIIRHCKKIIVNFSHKARGEKMHFQNILDTTPIVKNPKGIIQRQAVRAIIVNENKILLIQTNRGEYKFPGGGVEENESHAEALIREMREETGYINCIVKDLLGIVIEQKMDEFEVDYLFQMTSYYYICALTNKETVHQKLDAYETVQEFKPKWVNLEDAIKQNETLFTYPGMNNWLKRETLVLNEVKELAIKRNKMTIKRNK